MNSFEEKLNEWERESDCFDIEFDYVNLEFTKISYERKRISKLISIVRKQRAALNNIQKEVDEQAEDEGLWCSAERIVEAYIQQELRKLHSIIESNTNIVQECEELLSGKEA